MSSARLLILAGLYAWPAAVLAEGLAAPRNVRPELSLERCQFGGSRGWYGTVSGPKTDGVGPVFELGLGSDHDSGALWVTAGVRRRWEGLGLARPFIQVQGGPVVGGGRDAAGATLMILPGVGVDIGGSTIHVSAGVDAMVMLGAEVMARFSAGVVVGLPR
jgi:hypothetical protein